MSGETVPYRLRPHKAVDRRLFLALLSRCERWIDLNEYVYASMGAYSLEDHKLVHRLLGITRLLTFDMLPAVVARQNFNRPADGCKCVCLTSGQFTADVSSAVESAGIRDAEGFVVWLDYTSPKDIPIQLREFEKLVAQFAPGDIVRVTVNAEFDYWAGAKKRPNGSAVPLVEKQGVALQRLTRSLGEYLPNGVKAENLDPAGIAEVLSMAFGIAANKGVPARDGNVLEPISVTRYADGQQMLSMTAVVVARDRRDEMRKQMALKDWPFASSGWQDIKSLIVPDLTVRERLYLEQNARKTSAQIEKAVGFDFDTVTGMPGFIENFKQYYRHYPALTPVEL